MKFWKLAAIAASFAAASPALAQDGAKIGVWTINANPDNKTCMAFAGGGTSFFGIQHSDDPAQRFMLINNSAWTSIENGAEYQGTLTVGKGFATNFTGVVSSDITPTLGATPPEGFDAALARATSIRVQVASLNIDTSVPITDGKKLWNALATCVANKR